jgi:lipopolysaccharide export system ATP-binding protein
MTPPRKGRRGGERGTRGRRAAQRQAAVESKASNSPAPEVASAEPVTAEQQETGPAEASSIKESAPASDQRAAGRVTEPRISDPHAAEAVSTESATAEHQSDTLAKASPVEEPPVARRETGHHPPAESQGSKSLSQEPEAGVADHAEARLMVPETVEDQSVLPRQVEPQTATGQQAEAGATELKATEFRTADPGKAADPLAELLVGELRAAEPEKPTRPVVEVLGVAPRTMAPLARIPESRGKEPEKTLPGVGESPRADARTVPAQARTAEPRPEQRPNAEREIGERRIGDRRGVERPTGDRQQTEPRVPLKVLQGGGGLIARGVGKTYKRRPVVRNVSVSLNRGEAVGLLGPNGAGKTTTFYMIVGLVSPDTGTIHLDGADITTLPMYRRARLGIGYLPQEASVFRGLNVEQNVMAALEVVEPDLATRRLMLDELLGEFWIGHLRRTPALALSGGERRRVEIARALATQPSYILLDEPLAGIDPIAVSEIRDLVKHLKDRGIGVLITDHNVRETLEIIDRAYIMHDGQVLMEGTPNEVVANRDVRRVYLGERFSL